MEKEIIKISAKRHSLTQKEVEAEKGILSAAQIGETFTLKAVIGRIRLKGKEIVHEPGMVDRAETVIYIDKERFLLIMN